MLSLLSGCNLPFTILCAVAFGSIICSYIIGTEAESLPHAGFAPRPTIIPKPIHFAGHNPVDQPASTKCPIVSPGDTFFNDHKYLWDSEHSANFGDELFKPPISRHYTCPPTTLEVLRKRFGTRKSLWGEWSPSETRQFYKSQLPKALQIDGALGLSLVERAHLASANRHALRLYARERCHLPSRLAATLYDGLRHLHYFGTWCASGMTWPEVQRKYRKEALLYLGSGATEQEISYFVYRRIVDKACSTSAFFDRMATDGMCTTSAKRLCSIIKSPASHSNNAVSSHSHTNSVVNSDVTSSDVVGSGGGSTGAVDKNTCTDTGLNVDLCETQFAPSIQLCCSGHSGSGVTQSSTITKFSSRVRSIWSAAFNVLLMALSSSLAQVGA